MKHMIMMITGIVISVLTFLIILTMLGRMNYASELESQLPAAVEATLSNVMVKHTYPIADETELIADFTQQLVNACDAAAGMTVQVMCSDMEKGLFSVKVIRDFSHPNGMAGTVESSRTVLLERTETLKMQWYQVEFFKDTQENDGSCYKRFCVMQGDTITAPAEPTELGKNFVGWQDCNGYAADFSQPIEQDRTYYAVWE